MPDQTIRVMKFLNGFAFGGTETQAAHLMRGLDRSTFEIHIGCLKALGHLTGEFRGGAASFEEYRVDRLYGFRAMKQFIRLSRDLRRRRIDVEVLRRRLSHRRRHDDRGA